MPIRKKNLRLVLFRNKRLTNYPAIGAQYLLTYLPRQVSKLSMLLKGIGRVYQPTLRCRIYESIGQLQADLDIWLDSYNNECTHQGKRCDGKTPMETLLGGKLIWKEKFMN